MQVTLWVKENCVQCNQTKREFDRRGIIYQIKRLDKSPKAVERFIEMGLFSAPIVETDDRRWGGFRLNRIQSLEHHLKFERKRGENVPLKPIVQVADEVCANDLGGYTPDDLIALIKDESKMITSELLPDGTIRIEEIKGEQK